MKKNQQHRAILRGVVGSTLAVCVALYGFVLAQPGPEALAACAAIESEAARLDCYDGLAAGRADSGPAESEPERAQRDSRRRGGDPVAMPATLWKHHPPRKMTALTWRWKSQWPVLAKMRRWPP